MFLQINTCHAVLSTVMYFVPVLEKNYYRTPLILLIIFFSTLPDFSFIRVRERFNEFGIVESNFGLFQYTECSFPDLALYSTSGGTQRLPRLVGLAMAQYMIFTGMVIDGRQAERLGVVQESVEQNEAGDAAYQKCLEIASVILQKVGRSYTTVPHIICVFL